ncbi:MAG TPA: RibD family protein [Candidatus Thermoplasmatota archaeon]|nr:RibD family protein [Candidatus Thermoplasmatota archaeon]
MARPVVLLNCACSLDGRLAAPDGSPLPFSDEVDWRRVHLLRAESEAVLVGVNTVLSDDPSLKVKEDHAPLRPGHRLLRVVLDAKGRTPPGARVADGSAPSLIVTAKGVKGRWARAEHATVPESEEGRLDLNAVLDLLARRGVEQLLVEGGGTVLRAFVDAGLCDRWTIYQAPVLVGGAGPSIFPGRPSSIGRRLHVENVEPQGKGVLWTLRP